MARRGLYKGTHFEQMKPHKGTNYLLVIGVDDYLVGIPRLNNAKNDAESLMNLLLSKYQFDSEHTYSLFNEEASKKNILDTFDKLVSIIGKTDNLVLFYAGHGKFHKVTKRGYWIPADAKANDRSSFISNSEVIDFFRSLRALHVFGIVDSCFSAALFLRNLEYITEEVSSIPSRWLLTSGRLEPVADGFGTNSPFTSSLLTHLEANKRPLRVSELSQKVLLGTSANAELQIPRGEPLQNVGHQGGEFVFQLRGGESSVPERPIAPNIQGKAPTPRPIKINLVVEIDGEQVHFESSDFGQFKFELKERVTEDIKQGVAILRKIILLKSDKQNELLIHLASYSRNKTDARKNLISRDAALIKENFLRHALSQFIDELSLKHLRPQFRAYFE